MRTLLLAATLALATQVSLGTDINIGDVGYKTAFAASSTALYRTTLSIASSWTGNSADWSTLASTGSTSIGYSRVRHCYTGTNLYMVAIDTNGALRIVTYSIDDDGSDIGEPEYVSQVDFGSITGHALSSDVSGVFCNKGKVFVVKNANNPTLYYHTNIASITSGSNTFGTVTLTGSGSTFCGTDSTMVTKDIFVADGSSDSNFNAYISTDKSILLAYLSQSSTMMSLSSCSLPYNPNPSIGVTRMHVDTGINRLYFYHAASSSYNSGVLDSDNDLSYISTNSAGSSPITLVTAAGSRCYDVFVSDDIVWVACDVDVSNNKRIRKAISLTTTTPSSNLENIGSGDLSTATYAMQTISVFDPSSSAAFGPSVGVALCAVAALLGARRAL